MILPPHCHTAFTAEENFADLSLKRRQMAETHTPKKGWNKNARVFYFLGD